MLEIVTKTLQEHHLLPDKGIVVVAVSGGADSLCLLHLLHQLCGPGKTYPEVQLHVAHLNHQLRGQASNEDALAVARLAEQMALPYTIDKADVQAIARREHRSLEEAARLVRYQFLRQVALGQPIAVAHHRDDQVETLLLHWLRGGGMASMVGLQPRQRDIIRPLLRVRREDTHRYCQEHGLVPQEDASNQDTRFLRNRVRHELLPLLEGMNPGFRETLLRNAEIIRLDYEWLEEQVQHHWPQILLQEMPGRIILAIPPLRQLSLSLQRHLLRKASTHLCDGQSPLELRHFHLLEQLIQREHAYEELTLHLPQQLHARRRGDILVLEHVHDTITHNASSQQQVEVTLSLPGSCLVPGTSWTAVADFIAEEVHQQVIPALRRQDWREVWHLLPSTPYSVCIDADSLGETELRVRTRRDGDHMHPLGMRQEKRIQDVLIDNHIPREVRDQLPIFFSSTHCVWLGGVRLDDRVRLTSETQRIARLSIISTDK